MKNFFGLFFSIVLLANIAWAADDCCDLFEDSQVSIKSLDSFSVDPRDSDQGQEHDCIDCSCCSNNSLIQISSSLGLDIPFSESQQSQFYSRFVPNHYIDRPFQPPRA